MTTLQELLVAVRRKLLANPDFTALLGTDVGTDAVGQAYNDGWVFKTSTSSYESERSVRGTGTSAIVFGSRAPWTSPNISNTLRFPLLTFYIYSDSTRSAGSDLIEALDADLRCDRVATIILDTFNDVANNDHNWPNGVYIVSSVLWTDLRINDVPNEDGQVVGDMSFALELG